MDIRGFEKVSEVAASVAKENGTEVRVTGMPEQGPPYTGVKVEMGIYSQEHAFRQQKELRKALGEAGLLYIESEGDEPTNSPALKSWSGSLYDLEFVDMSTEHGRWMDAVYPSH